MCDSNEQHVTEFDSTKDAAEEVVTRNSEDAIQSFDGKFPMLFMLSLSVSKSFIFLFF